MELKHTFETMELDGEIMAVAMDCAADEDRVMLRLNGSAADILALLKDDTTEDAVVAGMLEQYDADEATIRENVRDYIQTLREANLIVE